MCVKLLTEHDLVFLSLKRGCTGSSESTLVKMPHCWKSHVMTHISMVLGTRLPYTSHTSVSNAILPGIVAVRVKDYV